MAVTLTGTLVVHSPEWWLKRLTERLQKQQQTCKEYNDFFDGVQPLAFASRKFQETFGQRYARLPANLMPLVVDAERERLIVQGFRFGNKSEGDKTAWRIWQDNNLDAESQIAHEVALVCGASYTMVTTGPMITIEDPRNVILETLPGNRRVREAALKSWMDDDGHLRSYIYTPDFIFKYRSEKPQDETSTIAYGEMKWEEWLDDGEEDWPVSNQLGVVPIVPLLNRPTLNGKGRSEIAPVMGNQSAINKIRFDALVASEFVAFPQRYAINIDIPIDEDTGKEIQPFRPGVDNLWATRRPTPDEAIEYADKFPTPSFGQFPAADLGPYIDMERQEVGLMASISRTPYHYLLGEPTSIPPSGESIKSSEAALVKKVEGQSVHFGEGWEETMRLALAVAGQSSKARTDAETIWADPETRNEAARTDSILKQYQAGLLDDATALGELGYSQQQIERIMAAKAAAAIPPVLPPGQSVAPLTTAASDEPIV